MSKPVSPINKCEELTLGSEPAILAISTSSSKCSPKGPLLLLLIGDNMQHNEPASIVTVIGYGDSGFMAANSFKVSSNCSGTDL